MNQFVLIHKLHENILLCLFCYIAPIKLTSQCGPQGKKTLQDIVAYVYFWSRMGTGTGRIFVWLCLRKLTQADCSVYSRETVLLQELLDAEFMFAGFAF